MQAPILQPEIAGNLAVVLVHLAVAVPPVLELAGGHVEPHNGRPGADLGLEITIASRAPPWPV